MCGAKTCFNYLLCEIENYDNEAKLRHLFLPILSLWVTVAAVVVVGLGVLLPRCPLSRKHYSHTLHVVLCNIQHQLLTSTSIIFILSSA